MGIGGSIIVLALGAILTFGVSWHLAGMNIHVVGVILMGAGLLSLITYAFVFRRRSGGGRPGGKEVVRERLPYDGP